MSELPRWDVVPELQVEEKLPIPVNPDENWATMANYLYSGRNYQTMVFAATYKLAKVGKDGHIIPGSYVPREFRDFDEELTPHQFIGIFKSVEVRNYLKNTSMPVGIPFARLSHAHDIDTGVPLTYVPGQDVLVPLINVDVLTLERR